MVGHAAFLQDPTGADLVLSRVTGRFPRLPLLWADGSSASAADWVREQLTCSLATVPRAADQRGFRVLPKRWIVERTVGRDGRYRRLSTDHEQDPHLSEGMVDLASIRLIRRRLDRNKRFIPAARLPFQPLRCTVALSLTTARCVAR